MKDKSVNLVRKFAERLSVERTNGYVSFIFKDEFKGKTKLKVKIPEENLELIAESDGDDKTIENAFLSELEIIGV